MVSKWSGRLITKAASVKVPARVGNPTLAGLQALTRSCNRSENDARRRQMRRWLHPFPWKTEGVSNRPVKGDKIRLTSAFRFSLAPVQNRHTRGRDIASFHQTRVLLPLASFPWGCSHTKHPPTPWCLRQTARGHIFPPAAARVHQMGHGKECGYLGRFCRDAHLP